jgi:vacuolar protein sorting-associated protein 72
MAAVDEASSFTGADTSEDEAVIESLIAGRQKRSTAGRNMSSLLDAAADDDLTLLFAEDENDDEFDQDEGADGDFDDMRLDSSSEDEDENAADDDLEGERELEKQARADRKKRKAQESLRLTALRKKVKIDSPMVANNAPSDMTETITPRPKKKSERVSWLPTPEEGPVRSSSRRQTMQNKELTHARLKDSEQRRIKLIATMEQAAKRKQRTKPKVKTQEERLAEAEKIERLNKKTLNRWEEMEKRKAEERQAKLEALQNRRLEGPVMSWWSGIAKWANGKLVRVGNVEVKPKIEKEEAERKKKSAAKDAAAQEAPKVETKTDEVPATTNNLALPPPEVVPVPGATVPTATTAGSVENATKPDDTVPPALEDEQATSLGFLDGIHHYASLPATPAHETTEVEAKASEPENKPELADSAGKEQSKDEDGKTETTSHDQPVEPPVNASREETRPAEDSKGVLEEKPQSDSNSADGQPGETPSSQDVPQVASNEAGVESTQAATETVAKENINQSGVVGTENVEPTVPAVPATGEAKQTEQVATETSEMDIDKPVSVSESILPGEAEAAAPAQPEVTEQTGRNLLVLENFDNAAMQSRQYSIYFNSKKPPRLTSAYSFPSCSWPTYKLTDCRNIIAPLPDNVTTIAVPRSGHGPAVCEHGWVSRNPQSDRAKVHVEWDAGVLCRQCDCGGQRCAGAIYYRREARAFCRCFG